MSSGPGPTRIPMPTTTCSSSRDCGTLDRIGAVVGATSRAVRAAAAGRHRPSRLERRGAATADWIDPAARRPARWSTLLAARLGVPLDRGRRCAREPSSWPAIVMDTATFAHPNATPRTLAVSAALVEAGAPLSDISRRLYRSKPEAQLRLFGRVLDRLETDSGRPDRPHDACSTPTSPRPARSPPHSEGIIDLLAQAEEAEIAIVFKEAGEGTRISVRTKPGGVDATVLTGAFGGGGHARAAGATIAAARRRAHGPRSSPRPNDSSPLSLARARLPAMDGILVVAKPVGPTSHDVVGARSPPGVDEAGRPRRNARSVRERRSADFPRQGDARRRVPPRRPKGISGDRLLRCVVDDGRP